MAKIIYETTTCSRCGGCGHYSWNAVDGSKCYGCHGTGKSYTKQAAKAITAVDAKRTELLQTTFGEIKEGDFILARVGCSAKEKSYKVKEVELTTGAVNGKPIIMLRLNSQNNDGFGATSETIIKRAHTDDTLEALLSFAEQFIGKGVKEVVRDQKTA
jgi:hypothetical protein